MARPLQPLAHGRRLYVRTHGALGHSGYAASRGIVTPSRNLRLAADFTGQRERL